MDFINIDLDDFLGEYLSIYIILNFWLEIFSVFESQNSLKMALSL